MLALSLGPTTTPSAGAQVQLTMIPSGWTTMVSGSLRDTWTDARYSRETGNRSTGGAHSVARCSCESFARRSDTIGPPIRKDEGNVIPTGGPGAERPEQVRIGR